MEVRGNIKAKRFYAIPWNLESANFDDMSNFVELGIRLTHLRV